MQPDIALNGRTTGGHHGRRSKLLLMALLAAGSLGRPLPAVAAGDEVLQKVVIIARHGVRTPITSQAELDGWSSRPWPAWNEPAGNLTARGAQLAKILGQCYRAYAVSEQLLPEQGCPQRGSLYVYADLEERTKTHGAGIARRHRAWMRPRLPQQAGCDRRRSLSSRRGGRVPAGSP